ncbi:MAG: ABC transporter substrate-binding protein [Candidatus Omnitrophica bacterium]|nr:ABC transporter substrate-binding protein [Candidatus Omnitrophota bacterium]
MSKKKKIFNLLFVILFILCVGFFFKNNVSIKIYRHFKAAISTETESTSHNEKYGGTLVLGTSNAPAIINPILTQHSVSVILIGLIFDSLIRVDESGNVVPGLAYKWDISDDGLDYIFYLREDVYFHDGVPLTAEDVKFTYDLHRSKNIPSFRYVSYDAVQDIVVLDKLTIKVSLKKKNIFFLRRLLSSIVPKHVYEGKNLAEADFNYAPVGSGIYKFHSWNKTTNQIELVVNEHYFDDRANLDRIIIRTYKTIPQLWAALLRGEVDLIKYISRKDYNVLKKDPTFQTFKIVGFIFSAIYFNPDSQLLSDPEVRKAVSMSIDRKQLIDALSQGGAECYSPLSMDRDKESDTYRYDPLKAKLKLMHRGWMDADGDGILEKDLQDFEIRLMVNQRSDFFTKLALLLRQQLSEVGIKVTILLYADESDLNTDYVRTHRANAWLRFFMGGTRDEDRLYPILGTWSSSSNLFGQIWKYHNPEIDRIFNAVSQADKPDREKLFRQAGQILFEDQPVSCLFYTEDYHAVSARIKNVEFFFYGYVSAYSIKDWYIQDH